MFREFRLCLYLLIALDAAQRRGSKSSRAGRDPLRRCQCRVASLVAVWRRGQGAHGGIRRCGIRARQQHVPVATAAVGYGCYAVPWL